MKRPGAPLSNVSVGPDDLVGSAVVGSARSLYVLEPMRVEDIPQAVAIEKATFSNPWSHEAFEHEIVDNRVSHPTVARAVESDERAIAGYCVMWVVFEDIHIQNIAVHPQHQRRGLGRYLLEDAQEAGSRTGARGVLLEVRESNTVARRLYISMGFREAGKRRGYYSCPEEDAILYQKDLLDAGSC